MQLCSTLVWGNFKGIPRLVHLWIFGMVNLMEMSEGKITNDYLLKVLKPSICPLASSDVPFSLFHASRCNFDELNECDAV